MKRGAFALVGAGTIAAVLTVASCSGGGSKHSDPTASPSPIPTATPSGVTTPSPSASPSPDPTPTPQRAATLTGQAALGDWTTDAPGVRRRVTVGDLPAPFATQSASNGSRIVPRPTGAWPRVPDGFSVQLYAENLNNPRNVAVAPNGDVFVVESAANRVRVFRGVGADGKAQQTEIFGGGLNQPFGIAFYPTGENPQWVYVANTDSVVRFPYQNGDLTARGAAQTVVDNISPGGRLTGGGHWTRGIAFSNDNQTLYVSVGSKSNIDENTDAEEERRARIYAYSPDGTNGRVFATGIRNPVGLAVHPTTGQLWTSVNERDGLGDHLVPDYITHVEEGGFYGWPWYYIGNNQDPRKTNAAPDLKARTLVPDVLLQSHSASLNLCFYSGAMFPSEYRNEIFACEHGSWNRARSTGYKIVRVPLQNGKATGEYEDFLTGFVADNGQVWGRPVGIAVAGDGALLITDDGANCIWRVTYAGNRQKTR